MKTPHIALVVLFSSFYQLLSAQVWPPVQDLKTQQGQLSASNFTLVGRSQLDPSNQKFLEQIVPIQAKGAKARIRISLIKANKTSPQEYYTIRINAKEIHLAGKNQRSLFYALQTLNQLKKSEKGLVVFPYLQITDYPDVPIRGTVEGFYGTPWSFEDRLSQLDFYGKLKLNTYIYGPKDDPYHSSPHWRDAYPADKAEEIKKLISKAEENKVNFVWAVHPGKDIQWNHSDSLKLLHKFKLMYDLGVRSFAVFFDDISGEGTKPQKQADLMNYLHHAFVQKHTDVEPLIVCPTEYNKSWANPKPGTYLDILGQELEPSIQVMWTGDRVISDIDRQATEWINKRIKRKAFIWWNFPVNDYVRDHLLMGPAYGNALDIKDEISGFVSNPMERAEASKIAIFGVANYTWNMARYNAIASFEQACQYLAPKAAKALQLFAENNSDLGPNGHRYRRNESVKIKSLVDYVARHLQEPASADSLLKLKHYFEQVAAAPQQIENNSNNPQLLKEIQAWLNQFALLGKAGSSQLLAWYNWQQQDLAQKWEHYLKVKKYLEEMKRIDGGENQNPYQPGVKTASLVLQPFVQKAYTYYGQRAVLNIDSNTKATAVAEQLLSNIEQLKAQKLIVQEKQISISPVFEPIRLAAGNYFGLSWLDNRVATQLKYNLSETKLGQWAAIEYSKDGNTWQAAEIVLKENAKTIQLPADLKALRLVNRSDSSQTLLLKQFTVLSKENNNSRDLKLIEDHDLNTFVAIPSGEQISISPTSQKGIAILMDNSAQELQIKNGTKIIYQGQSAFVLLNKQQLDVSKPVEIINLGKEKIRIFEIIPQ